MPIRYVAFGPIGFEVGEWFPSRSLCERLSTALDAAASPRALLMYKRIMLRHKTVKHVAYRIHLAACVTTSIADFWSLSSHDSWTALKGSCPLAMLLSMSLGDHHWTVTALGLSFSLSWLSTFRSWRILYCGVARIPILHYTCGL